MHLAWHDETRRDPEMLLQRQERTGKVSTVIPVQVTYRTDILIFQTHISTGIILLFIFHSLLQIIVPFLESSCLINPGK